MNYATKMSGFRDMRMKVWLEKKGANQDLPLHMITQKTAYTKKHFDKVIRFDDKLLLCKKGLFIDLLQVEVNDAQRFLDNYDMVYQSINTLHKKHNVLCILHLHDIQQRKTYLLSNYEYFLRYLAKEPRCTGVYKKMYVEFSELWIRKDTIPVLENIFAHIDNSLILRKFLK